MKKPTYKGKELLPLSVIDAARDGVVCNSKTRIKLRLDTELKNFPLFCPKCKQETLISVEKFKILVTTEPDAQTQSR